ncbi:ty3-gypsy retrotransposon protein [Cucumis melo var. makuwa]|uniref:Ty3-gypsy retrotransposon protein n=1 Tax=Cucumis melo var. makuwa TaxID=1194695 RepID=A0A5D3BQF7_CUCMM|nr:ty3-gypsy retrotransposon protein [Cucumis melo var. makuwa]TYK02011.1 ty3-gypsy retrotransposon protein [Cucumis melo var. makuwa]
MTSQGNIFKALSDISKRPNTRSHSRETQSSNDMPPFEEVSHSNIMSIMVTDMETSEDRMTELEKKINMLIKAVEERDYEITSLKNHIKSRNVAESSHTHTIKNIDKRKAVLQERQPQNPTSIASLSVQQFIRRIVNMMKLTNTRQRKGEQVIDYINRWRALSLDCKDRLTEL